MAHNEAAGTQAADGSGAQHRLMVLGSMDSFVELVKRAQERGIYVISCDGYTGGAAKAAADEALDIDVRDTAAIARACADKRVDGIIASFSDLLAECLVNIADAAGLPCYATPERFRYLREKPLMKQMFAELGVPTPQSASVRRETLAADLAPIGFPCVVKPANGYGSRGVYVLESAEEVRERFDEVASYSAFDYIVAERLMTGHEFNMMCWIMGGEVQVIGIADREKSFEVPKAVPHVSRNVYPSRLIDSVLEDARGIVGKIAAYVGIEDGPISMQFFYSPDEGIQVCEAAGRFFGYEHELVEIASGFSIEDLLLNYVYDRDAIPGQFATHDAHYPKCSAVLYFHGHERTVADLDPAKAALDDPHIVDATYFYEPGDTVNHGVGAMPYVIRAYARADTRPEMDELTERVFAQAAVLDEAGDDLLYANRMTEYGA